jgi:hypothetical protein
MERMEKQTAVDWLVKQLRINGVILVGSDYEIIDQANEMFEQQIKDSWNDGYREFYDGSSTPEEYYKKTFKSE